MSANASEIFKTPHFLKKLKEMSNTSYKT